MKEVGALEATTPATVGVTATAGALDVALLDYGAGNLHSAAKALERAGGRVRLVTSVSDARDVLVIPGVGAYGACLAGLGPAGGLEAVRAWLTSGRPLLGICVGMQLLYEGSEEGEVRDGVGAVAGTVGRLVAPGQKIPHMGWNEVWPTQPTRLFAGLAPGSRAYFVHSYAGPVAPGATAATCVYGDTFATALERDNLFATQFHPEKSGAVGLRVLSNFLSAAALLVGAGPCSVPPR